MKPVVVWMPFALVACALVLSFAPVPGGLPPVCDAGAVQFVECDGPVSSCPLDGTASLDPENDPLTYLWTDPNPNTWFDDPTSATPMLFADMGANCLVECGQIELTVTDPGGLSSTCTTAVVFEDTTPPDLICPADLILDWDGGWPWQTDPALTGMAIGIDTRDPNPVVCYCDELTLGVPPSGIEQIVERTWFVEDMCGFVTTDVQIITIVGPSFYEQTTIDAMPSSCPNIFFAPSEGTFFVTLFGDEDFDAATATELSLCRSDGVGEFCEPFWGQLIDVGSPLPGQQCSSTVPDGRLDRLFMFDRTEAFDLMNLEMLGCTSALQIQMQGIGADGVPFAARDIIHVITLQDYQTPRLKSATTAAFGNQ